MGTGGMVGGAGWDHPPTDENFGEPPPLRRWTQGPGGGKFLAVEGGRKFFHPPWEAIFFEITTPVKKY